MSLPEPNEFMPVLHAPRLQKIFLWLFKKIGWQLVGDLPREPKVIIAAAPHTTNWDFVYSCIIILAMNIKVSIMMKQQAFVWPVGKLWRWLGFVPIDRKQATNVVDQVAKEFQKRDKFWLVITPEGTRSKVKKWKTGFLRMAHAADVPVALVALDYPTKTLRFLRTFKSTGNFDEEVYQLMEEFKRYRGKHPDKS